MISFRDFETMKQISYHLGLIFITKELTLDGTRDGNRYVRKYNRTKESFWGTPKSNGYYAVEYKFAGNKLYIHSLKIVEVMR